MHISPSRTATLIGLFLALFSTAAFAAVIPSIQGAGDLPGGSTTSRAFGVCDAGMLVGQSISSNGPEAFRFAGDALSGLGDLAGGAFSSIATAVSDDGAVIVGYSDSGTGGADPGEAFVWTPTGGLAALGSLNGGDDRSYALGVSDDGAVVVGCARTSTGWEAFRWTAGQGMIGIGDLAGGACNSEASDASADGTVIVGESSSANGTEAFRWTATGGMTGLGDLAGGAFESWARAVSADGNVIVGYGTSATGQEAFRWTSAGMVGLGDLPGGAFTSEALGVSGDGSIVVGYGATSNGERAIIWDADRGLRDLAEVLITHGLEYELTGWTLNRATAISSNGAIIAGYGVNPDGATEAWRATLAPAASFYGFDDANGLADWENDTSPAGVATYDLTTHDGEGVLRVTAEAGENDRVKVRTVDSYRAGTYQWRVFIPEITETGATNAIAAFLFSDQSGDDLNAREIDFEIGEGTSADRQLYNIPAGHLICWMTVQRDDSSSTILDQVAYQPADPYDHVERGYWYTYTIHLGKDSTGRYLVSWFIQKDGEPQVKGRPDAICGYGPADTAFQAYCSSENFDTNWIGDHNPPQSDQVGYFDYFAFIPNDGNLITDCEQDTTSGAAPPGTSPREWTRFGPAYDDLLIGEPPQPPPVLLTDLSAPDFCEWSEANPAPGDPGYDPDLHGGFPDTAVDYEWSRFGAAFNGMYMQTTAVNDGPTIHYQAKRGASGASMLLKVVIEETDGDVWITSNGHIVTTTFTGYSVELNSATLELADNSGGADLDHDIALLGFVIERNGATSTPSMFIDNVYWSTATDPDTDILITDVSSDTLGTYPPGSDNQWTRFGDAFNVLQITSGAIEAIMDFVGSGTTCSLRYNVSGDSLDASGDPPNRYLLTLADWSAGSSLGIRYHLADAPLDISGGPAFSYRMKLGLDPGLPDSDPLVKFAVHETDGDVWESRSAHQLTDTYQTYTQRVSFKYMQKVDGSGDGVLDPEDVEIVGFNFYAGDGETSGVPFFYVDDLYWRAEVPADNNAAVAIADWSQGAWFGVQYNIPDAPLDLSAGPVVSYRMRYDEVGDPRVKLQVRDDDGEVWESTEAHGLTDEYVTYRRDLARDTFTRVDGSGDNALNLAAIENLGFVFLANGASSGTPIFEIDEIYSHEVSNPALPLITSAEDPDTVYVPAGQSIPGFPPDPTAQDFPSGRSEGQWTRFGVPFESLHIVSDAATSAHQRRHVELTANWAEPGGDKVGIRYIPFDYPLDLSAAHALLYDVAVDSADANTTHQIALVEGDGNIWLGPARSVGTSYATEGVLLGCELELEPNSGTGTTLDLTDIVMVGINFTNTVSTGRQVFRFDNLRLGIPPEPAAPTIKCVEITPGGGAGSVAGNITGLGASSYYVKTFVETDVRYYQSTDDIDAYGDFEAVGFWGTTGTLWVVVYDASDDSFVTEWDFELD